MATNNVFPPNVSYQPQQPASFTSSYPHSAPATSIPVGMQSSAEARRASDESELTHRRSQHSLPSLQEVFLNVTTDSRDSPRALHPAHSFAAPRPPEPLSSFPASTRPTLSTRAAAPPPLSTLGLQPATHSYMGRDKETELRQAGDAVSQQLSGPYPNFPRQQVHQPQYPATVYHESGQRPAGQLPLPSLPRQLSPRQPSSATLSPLETGRAPVHHNEEIARNKYDGVLGPGFEASPYLDALNKVRKVRIIAN